MLKPRKNCLVCIAIKQDKSLLKRISESKQYVKDGEPLKAIARDYIGTFEYQSLYNHCKTHQALSLEDLEDRRIAQQARELQVNQLKQAVKHHDMRDELLSLGMADIRDGVTKLNGSNVVALLKQKADIEDKEKDREIALARMVADFASGAIVDVEEGEVV